MRTIGEVVATVVLLLVLVAGFAGSADPLRNISVALVVGLAWPLLLAASLVGLDVWRGANPWALPARLLAPLGAADVDSRATPPSVLPAVLPAAGLVAYLHVLPGSLEPRSVATALAVYSVWVLGGCLALGPRDWMRRGDVLGILFGWVASARRLAAWQPPHGAGVLAAVLAGGMLVTPLRRRLLVLPATDRPALREAAVALVLVAAVYTAVVVARRWPGASPALVVALVPGAAAVAVADSLQFTRVATSAQVVVRAVSDPLGRGWDLFGTAGRSLQPWFIDDPVRALAQALVTVGGFALGAVAIGRRHATGALDTRGRDVALGLLCALLAVAVAAFLST